MDEPETQSGPEVEQAYKELWVHTAGKPQLGQWGVELRRALRKPAPLARLAM
jgi:hypothetical protein